MKKASWLLFFLSLLIPSGAAAQTNDLASWTVQKVIGDAEDNKQAKARIIYRESSVEEEFDPNGKLRSRKPDKGTSTRTVDGSAKSRVAGFELDLYEILTDTYNFKLADTGNGTGLTVIDNRVYVVVDFAPKEGLRFRNLPDRFTHRLRGRIWVDVSGNYYYILKMEANISEEFSFTYWKWGIVPIPITVKKMSLTLNQERLGSGVVVERSAEATVVFDSLRDGSKEYSYAFDNFTPKR